MTKRVIVLGGGSGGSMVANKLARQLSKEIQNEEIEIVQITNSSKHIYQPGYLFIALNEKNPDHFIRSQSSIAHRNVQLIEDEITEIDVKNKFLKSKTSQYDYDFLVISTGSYPDFDSLPGLKEAASNFYTLEGATKLRDELVNFEKGTILITVDVPHKCPAAPLEMVLMLDDYFRKKGNRKDVVLKYTYPIGRVHSLQPVAEWAEPQFEQRGIEFETYFNLEEVRPKEKLAVTMDGEEHPFDLLISIPAHKGADVIIQSNLGDESGFIDTDRYSLKMAGQDDVYVIGDATNLPISKAGSTAHYQSEVLVKNLTNRLKGLPDTAVYNGKVACFLEASLEEASMITFDYQTPPAPARPSDFMHWFKGVYNELYWLNAKGIM
ncbi:NAD(P)/FAD-dependent oxidoreductase [Neobacillus sp. SM06]|uniref:NAD(P)/FAD-dependent oxidoreductase n=1 Tax=Neobacillus sp. SM06 TaxID=3422492 RepID=UPI003D26B70D